MTISIEDKPSLYLKTIEGLFDCREFTHEGNLSLRDLNAEYSKIWQCAEYVLFPNFVVSRVTDFEFEICPSSHIVDLGLITLIGPEYESFIIEYARERRPLEMELVSMQTFTGLVFKAKVKNQFAEWWNYIKVSRYGDLIEREFFYLSLTQEVPELRVIKVKPLEIFTHNGLYGLVTRDTNNLAPSYSYGDLKVYSKAYDYVVQRLKELGYSRSIKTLGPDNLRDVVNLALEHVCMYPKVYLFRKPYLEEIASTDKLKFWLTKSRLGYSDFRVLGPVLQSYKNLERIFSNLDSEEMVLGNPDRSPSNIFSGDSFTRTTGDDQLVCETSPLLILGSMSLRDIETSSEVYDVCTRVFEDYFRVGFPRLDTRKKVPIIKISSFLTEVRRGMYIFSRGGLETKTFRDNAYLLLARIRANNSRGWS